MASTTDAVVTSTTDADVTSTSDVLVNKLSIGSWLKVFVDRYESSYPGWNPREEDVRDARHGFLYSSTKGGTFASANFFLILDETFLTSIEDIRQMIPTSAIVRESSVWETCANRRIRNTKLVTIRNFMDDELILNIRQRYNPKIPGNTLDYDYVWIQGKSGGRCGQVRKVKEFAPVYKEE